MADIETIRPILQQHKQEHILDYWSTLTTQEQQQLFQQLSDIDFDYAMNCYKEIEEDIHASTEKYKEEDIEPVPQQVRGSVYDSAEDIHKYQQLGLDLIGKGKVGLLLLAGGQGTRLGVKYPKGMYDVGLPSHKSLLQLMAERLIKLRKMSKMSGVVPWYIMTSESTEQTTIDFMTENNYFGLNKDDVIFFNQSNLPCFDLKGNIILQDKHVIAMAPDGNGGIYRALDKKGILEDMMSRGIEYVHVYCVDNILVKVADPLFIGFCASKGAMCGIKVVEKRDANEKVGVLCRHKGKYCVMEYSELGDQMACKVDKDGRLVYNCGSIANHCFHVDFLQSLIKDSVNLRHHIAKKKIPYFNGSCTHTPDEVNGIKLEKFIFDVFEHTQSVVVWQVDRESEFSPLKNNDKAGIDCPTTARRSVYKVHKKWLEDAGAEVQCPSNMEEEVCEISPLVSYAGEDLEQVKGHQYTCPVVLN